MPPKRPKKQTAIDESIEEKRDNIEQQPRTETGTISKISVKSSEVDTKEIKQINNALSFPCPVCNSCLKMQNQIEINRKKGCKCKCVPFNFKISSSNKTINIEKTDEGILKVDTDDHELKLSWNREITPENEEHAKEVSKIVKEMMKK